MALSGGQTHWHSHDTIPTAAKFSVSPLSQRSAPAHVVDVCHRAFALPLLAEEDSSAAVCTILRHGSQVLNAEDPDQGQFCPPSGISHFSGNHDGYD